MTRTTILGLAGLGAGALVVAVPQLRKLAAKHPGAAFGIGVALAGATVLGIQQTLVYDAQSGEFAPPAELAVSDTTDTTVVSSDASE
jgi:hypothetical protein